MRTGNHRSRLSAAVVVWIALAGAAQAQTLTLADETGYAEFFAQSSFGNVTSQAYGAEAGYVVNPMLQIFGEIGWVRNTAPASLGTSAQTIASGIAAAAGNASYEVRQPVTFGAGGVKYLVPMEQSRVRPYLLAGFGIAAVKRDVTFSTTAGDVNQFATIGTDLSGTETKPMFSFGGGVGVPVGRMMIVDVQYRYGHVFTSDEGLNMNRVGVGLGVRF
ncbi:MAG TPA: outer membrane beta-barrel protein [Vicinamibacterales bacterium]